MATARKQQTVEAAVSGMRRVDCVRMVEGDRPRFFVVGVGHRFPVEREVNATVALALLDTVPCRYERPRVEVA
jgi:DNA-binding IclR family transcriptional regulator